MFLRVLSEQKQASVFIVPGTRMARTAHKTKPNCDVNNSMVMVSRGKLVVIRQLFQDLDDDAATFR